MNTTDNILFWQKQATTLHYYYNYYGFYQLKQDYKTAVLAVHYLMKRHK